MAAALNLSSCGLTNTTAKALIQTLVNNTGLVDLRLAGNRISKAMRSQVARVMALNRPEFVGGDDRLVQRAQQDMHVCLCQPPHALATVGA